MSVVGSARRGRQCSRSRYTNQPSVGSHSIADAVKHTAVAPHSTRPTQTRLIGRMRAAPAGVADTATAGKTLAGARTTLSGAGTTLSGAGTALAGVAAGADARGSVPPAGVEEAARDDVVVAGAIHAEADGAGAAAALGALLLLLGALGVPCRWPPADSGRMLAGLRAMVSPLASTCTWERWLSSSHRRTRPVFPFRSARFSSEWISMESPGRAVQAPSIGERRVKLVGKKSVPAQYSQRGWVLIDRRRNWVARCIEQHRFLKVNDDTLIHRLAPEGPIDGVSFVSLIVSLRML